MVLPEGVKIDRAHRLATWHPRGVLDAATLREIHGCVETEEAAAPGPFHRFTDLSALDGIRLKFPEVEEHALSRIESYQGRRVKSAILATNPLAFGIARMYEQLMRRSPIEVSVFSDLESAAVWLGVPTEYLETDS